MKSIALFFKLINNEISENTIFIRYSHKLLKRMKSPIHFELFGYKVKHQRVFQVERELNSNDQIKLRYDGSTFILHLEHYYDNGRSYDVLLLTLDNDDDALSVITQMVTSGEELYDANCESLGK